MQMDSSQPNWLLLDDLIMETIFEQLSIRDRFNASLVCVLASPIRARKTFHILRHQNHTNPLNLHRFVADGRCVLNCRKYGEISILMINGC